MITFTIEEIYAKEILSKINKNTIEKHSSSFKIGEIHIPYNNFQIENGELTSANFFLKKSNVLSQKNLNILERIFSSKYKKPIKTIGEIESLLKEQNLYDDLIFQSYKNPDWWLIRGNYESMQKNLEAILSFSNQLRIKTSPFIIGNVTKNITPKDLYC